MVVGCVLCVANRKTILFRNDHRKAASVSRMVGHGAADAVPAGAAWRLWGVDCFLPKWKHGSFNRNLVKS